MNLPLIIAFTVSFFFGVMAIVFSVSEERTKRKILLENEKNRLRHYEITVLLEIQNRMGYTLNIEQVVDVLIGSLRSLSPYTTASALTIHKDNLQLKTYSEEIVSPTYLEEVKKHMVNSLHTMSGESLPQAIKELHLGVATDPANPNRIQTIFHIPLVVNNTLMGIFTVSSAQLNHYTEEEMATEYRISNQATAALGKLEKLLQNEKEKLMAMIGSLTEGVFMVDTNSKLLVINQAAKDLFHLTQPEITISDILMAIPPATDMTKLIQQSLAEKKPVKVAEILLGDKTCNAVIEPVFSGQTSNSLNLAEKEIIGVSILLHDVTLEKSVAQMKEDFTNIMVHELRSPLTAIKAASQLIVLQDEKLQGPERKKLLNLVYTQSAKLLDEVALILDSAKIEAGMLSVAKVPQDMKHMVDEKISFFQPEAENKQITLTTTLPDGQPLVMIDSRYIGQVINNLLSNALKFTPVGGQITISGQATNSAMQISVTDTGSGIPLDKQKMLFQKFSQIKSPNAQVGTGLGLYMVKGVVEAHGGSVSLHSEEGKGTTVSFTVPLAPANTTSTLPLTGVTASPISAIPTFSHPASLLNTPPPLQKPTPVSSHHEALVPEISPHPVPAVILHHYPEIHPQAEIVPFSTPQTNPPSVMVN